VSLRVELRRFPQKSVFAVKTVLHRDFGQINFALDRVTSVGKDRFGAGGTVHPLASTRVVALPCSNSRQIAPPAL